MKNIIYQAVSKIAEEREANGSYRGNGHHLAQEITEAVEAALKLAEGQKPPTNTASPKLFEQLQECVDLLNINLEYNRGKVSEKLNAVLAQLQA